MFLNKLFTVVVLVTVAAGCHKKTAAESRPFDASASSRASDVITADELAAPAVRSGDALEAVRRLRPRFLATRGAGSIRDTNVGTIQISVDGGPLLAVSNLGRMRAAEIAEMRYLSAADAAQRFGTRSASGPVILVKSR